MARSAQFVGAAIVSASLAIVLCLLVPTIASAGEYHFGPTLICAECHVEGRSALRAASADAVCLDCHDGKPGIPDVRGEDVNASNGPRQAGALTTGGVGWEDWKGHTLGSPGPPPGGQWPGGESALHCTSCHSPHGNANYRNLGGALPNPPAITYTVSNVPTNAVDVRIDLPGVPPVGERVAAGFYSARKVFFNEVSPLGSPYGAFCAGCHGDLHGTVNTGAVSPFRRHPTDGVGMPAAYVARYASGTSRVQVLAPGNGVSASYSTTASPSCMTCHRAHGNRNPFGLFFLSRSATSVDEQGGYATGQRADVPTGYRNLCGQCHVEGN